LGLTLLDLHRFLQDPTFRENLIPRINYEHVRNYFVFEFPKNEAGVHQWVTPVLNKIGSLVHDADIRLMLAKGTHLDFRGLIDQKHILLVNIPKGIIGEGPSALMGAFIVAHLQKAALSRAGVRRREPFYLYLDEFQNYTTDNIKDILSESRKYALSLTLANQYLDQLSADLRSAVLNTAGTLICFRVGYGDSYHLVKEIFPAPDFLTETERETKVGRIESFPFLVVEEKQKPLGWEGLAQLLTKLPLREFWCRKRGDFKPTKGRTFNMPDPQLSEDLKERREQLIDVSGQRYGRLKSKVIREFYKRNSSKRRHGPHTSPGSGFPPDEENDGVWGA
jgi:hypothetical protein